MSDVKIFTVDDKDIEVKDASARNSITTINNEISNIKTNTDTNSKDIATNTADILALKKLSRLSVSYDANDEKIIFTTGDHS